MLLFLWNESGNRFLDLYAWNGRRVRLTNLEDVKDDLNLSAAEKDDRRKRYLEPARGIADFDMSRDGRRAAFAYRGDLWIVETGGGRLPLRLTKTRAVESNPRLAPEGRRLAFARDGQVLVQDLADGRLWQVTDIESEAGSLENFSWSPEGKRILYTQLAGKSRQVLLPNFSGRLITARSFDRTLAGDDPQEASTWVVASEGGKPRMMDPGPWGAKVYGAEPEWSPDSTRILQRVMHPSMKKQQILVHDAAEGKTVVAHEASDPAWAEEIFAAWSPDSKQVLFNSDRDGWFHLYRAPASGGEPAQITRGAWEVHPETFDHDPHWVGEFIYYSSTEAGPSERQFYRVRPDGSGKQKLSTREGVNAGFVSADARYTALLSADPSQPFDLYVNGERVTTSPRPEFSQYPWPETRFVQFRSRGDGRTVHAKMLLPPGFGPQDRRAVVFFIHGAGYATSVLKQWGSYMDVRFVFNCYLANRGYVVMDLDYRGSSGYGRDWRAGVYLHMGGKDLDDVLGAVDYLRGMPGIDAGRMGVWGSSYGGFLTNMAMFLSPETFRAGASWAAVNDWENYGAFYTEQRLTRPQQNPEAYRRSSPIHFSQSLRNPLLIVHGMVDSNVLFQDAVQLAGKLIYERKDFAQIYYPEEDHLFVRDETLIDAFRRTAEWMDRHLR